MEKNKSKEYLIELYKSNNYDSVANEKLWGELKKNLYSIFMKRPNDDKAWHIAEKQAIQILTKLTDKKYTNTIIKKIKEDSDFVFKRLESKPVTPFMFWVYMIKKARIEYIIKKQGLDTTFEVSIGFLDSGRINSSVKSFPPDEYIIFVDNGLKSFSNYYTKLFAEAYAYIHSHMLKNEDDFSEDTIKTILSGNKKLITRFENILFSILIKGDPNAAAPPKDFDESLRELAGKIEEGLDLFVMGHEYSHIVLGHLKNKEREIIRVNTKKVDIALFNNHEEEYEADVFGMRLMIECFSDADKKLGFIGAYIFFNIYYILEMSLSILKFGKETVKLSSTHPNVQSRKNNLYFMYKKYFDYYDTDITLNGMCMLADEISTYFFTTVRDQLYAYHKNRIKLAPKFN